MRVLIHDFGGYAFPVTLSQALHNRGYEVIHAYCASLVTTPTGVSMDSVDFSFRPIHTSSPINKYNLLQRWLQEREYGRLAASVVLDSNPDVVISANTPLSAQRRIQKASSEAGIPFIFWLQDLIGLASSRVLNSKFPLFGSIIGRYFQLIEGHLLRRSDAIIAITDDFLAALQKFKVAPDRHHVIENWGILDRFDGDPIIWTARTQLDSRPILLYAGTLSMKHNPATLLHLAERLGEAAQIVVVSQGVGAEWLKKMAPLHGLSNLIVLPYQNPEQLPAMYASATILLILLTEDAGKFSVPSKVLTCLCAGRPVLAAIPSDNLAARILQCSGAGLISEPDDDVQFTQNAQQLLHEPELCQSMGENARNWADDKFEIQKITDRFERILRQVSR